MSRRDHIHTLAASRRDHIHTLAAQYGRNIMYDGRPYNESMVDWYPGRNLYIADWDSADPEILYGIALHELGHNVLEQAHWVDLRHQTIQEAEASLWGLEHGIHLTDVAVTALVHSVVARLSLGYGGWDTETVQTVLEHPYRPEDIPFLAPRANELHYVYNESRRDELGVAA